MLCGVYRMFLTCTKYGLDFHDDGHHDGAAVGALAEVLGNRVMHGDAHRVHVRTLRKVQFLDMIRRSFSVQTSDCVTRGYLCGESLPLIGRGGRQHMRSIVQTKNFLTGFAVPFGMKLFF